MAKGHEDRLDQMIFYIKKRERKNACILLKLREFSKWEYNRLVVNETVMESV